VRAKDYYIKAADEPSLYAALEAAGVVTIIPAHTEHVPAHIETIWEPVTDPAIIAEANAMADAQDFEIVEIEGETYSVIDESDVYRRAGEKEVRPAYERDVPQHIGAKPGYALDIIGPITRRIGGTDEEPIMQTLDGFHANLRGELSDEQIAKLPLIDAPANPVRVWA
jgi:hypothetical protein